jgi:A/G-specific adenine glycosylase
VDGNVERVTARLFAITEELPGAKRQIAAMAARLGEQNAAVARPSDFAQALFDLGAGLCTPTSPACALCPWRGDCSGRAQGIAASLPRKAPKKPRPVRHGVHFLVQDEAGRILLRRRPPEGLFGGMVELPGTPWRADPWEENEALQLAPISAAWQRKGQVQHGLTHFELRINVYAAMVERVEAEDGYLCLPDQLANEALASVMRRCVEIGLNFFLL